MLVMRAQSKLSSYDVKIPLKLDSFFGLIFQILKLLCNCNDHIFHSLNYMLLSTEHSFHVLS